MARKARIRDQLVPALEATDYLGVAARWAFEKDHHSRYGTGYRVIPIMQYLEPGPRGYKVIWPPERAATSFVDKSAAAGKAAA